MSNLTVEYSCCEKRYPLEVSDVHKSVREVDAQHAAECPEMAAERAAHDYADMLAEARDDRGDE